MHRMSRRIIQEGHQKKILEHQARATGACMQFWENHNGEDSDNVNEDIAIDDEGLNLAFARAKWTEDTIRDFATCSVILDSIES